MAHEDDELRKLVSKIESIESNIGSLNSELKHLKTSLNEFIQRNEKTSKEEFVIDKSLEEELSAPITGSYDIVPEKTIITPTRVTPIESMSTTSSDNKTPTYSKENTQKVGIVRPSLTTNTLPKKVETSPITQAPIKTEKPPVQIQTPIVPPPDIFDDLKNWIKSKIGNIPVEEFLGVNLLNKIGLLLLVVGFSLFLRLAYDWIGPFTKIIGMLLLSAGTLYGGERLYRNKSYSVFGLGLIASSFALFYFTVYASYNIDATRILNPDQGLLGFILLLIASGIIIGASLRYKMEVLTSFAYFLGFLTISINENADFNYFSMASVAILSVSLIGIMTVMHWKYLTGVGIFATYANYWLYAEGLPRNASGYLQRFSETGQNYYLESILYLLFFWLIFFISTFTMKIEDKKDEKICSAINIINAFSFLIMLGHVNPEPTEWGPFSVDMGMGISYIVGAYASRKMRREFLWKSSIVLGISLLTLAVPAKFSDYGHVFGWLIEGSILVILGFVYKESYLKNLGYFVLLLNLGRFFTLPYGDFFYSSNVAYPLLTFDLNRGLIYIFMLISFYGLIPFIRNYRSDWSSYDKIAYNAFGFLASLTLYLFSFYLVQKPYQAYVIIPVAGIILVLSNVLKNRNLYYSSVSIMVISLLISLGLIFQSNTNPNNFPEVVSLILIIFGNGFQYLLAKENNLLHRYSHEYDTIRHDKLLPIFNLKRLFFNGEIFLWVICIALVGLVLNEVSAYVHTVCILLAALVMFLINTKYQQGSKQGIALFCLGFLISLYRYGVFQDNREEKLNPEAWMALYNMLIFWLSGVGILLLKEKLSIKPESSKILSPILISATTLTAMMMGDILLKEPYLISFAAIYSLALVWSYKKLEDEFCIYNSLLIGWFSLILGLGGMIARKESPIGVYEHMSLVTYAISSVLTTALCFQLIENTIKRVFFYLQTLLTGFCFIIIVIPYEYRPLAFSVLHLGHLLFLFNFKVEKLYEYSYLTLVISIMFFLYQTNFPDSGKITEYKSISLVVGYSLLSILQVVLIFDNETKPRDRYLYYILTFIILFWSIHITAPLEYGVLLFSVFVYANSFLLSKFGIKEIEKLYYYPLGFTMFIFLYLLSTNESLTAGETNYKTFALGIVSLFLLLRSIKEAENYKAKQVEYKPQKYSFERITTLILFLEFILLTMTVTDIRWWSLIWTIEAFAFIAYGVFRNQPLIRYAGIGLIGLAVIKVGFWDLQNLKENTRVLVLISIGGLFVIASFLYAKYKDKLFKGEEES